MKLGWQLFIVFSAICLGLYLSQKPWQVYKVQQRKADGISLEMREAELKREQLVKDKMKASNPLGREQKIRDKNWTRPGETVLDGQ